MLSDYQGDLDRFYSHFTSIPNGTAPIDLRIDGGQAPPDAPHAPGWKQIYGESDLDLQCALPIIYPQNATIYQTDDQYYAHAADYGYDGLQLFNDFLDAVS
jgi:tripeptidyl-peptidase-1